MVSTKRMGSNLPIHLRMYLMVKYGMLLPTTYNGRRYTYPNGTIREHLISDTIKIVLE